MKLSLPLSISYQKNASSLLMEKLLKYFTELLLKEMYIEIENKNNLSK